MSGEAETALQALLVAHGPLVSLVGVRISLAAVPAADGLAPAVVYLARHETQLVMLGGAPPIDQVTFTIQCWADTALAAMAVAGAVKDACNTAPPVRACAVVEEAPVYDEETGLDGVVLTVEWWQ